MLTVLNIVFLYVRIAKKIGSSLVFPVKLSHIIEAVWNSYSIIIELYCKQPIPTLPAYYQVSVINNNLGA